MINRRTLLALSATVPFASRAPKLDMPDLRIDPIELAEGADVQVLGISPDARTLVGLLNREQICFYDVATLEQISITPATDFIGIFDPLSVQWNPAGTKIAFSLDGWRLGRDSDIFVVDVETAEITNITAEDDGDTAPSLFDGGPFNIDICPQWLDDETIVFARHHYDDNRDIDPAFYIIDLDGGEPKIWAETDSEEIVYVLSPSRLLDDGRIVFVGSSATNVFQLYSIAEGEQPTLLDTGEPKAFFLVDANERYGLIHDVRTFESLVIPINDPEGATSIEQVFELDSDVQRASDPSLGPHPDSLVLAVNNKNRTVLVKNGDVISEIAYLRGEDVGIQRIVWVPGTVLVCGKGAIWLIHHEAVN